MGVVFVAFQKTLKRQVAVKVLSKNRENLILAGELFRDEGEIVAGLAHPNIIPIFEMGETDDCYFQVMQLVDGIDLRSTVKRLSKHPIPTKRLMPLDEAIDIIIHVADALGYAHEEGVVHQDIKPANILIDNRTRRPLVADFGIARALMGEYKSEGLIVGSPLYMAPEQALGKMTDGRADIYSLGVMLFEMASGNLPIRHDDSVDHMLERKKFAPDTFFTKLPSQTSPRIDTFLEDNHACDRAAGRTALSGLRRSVQRSRTAAGRTLPVTNSQASGAIVDQRQAEACPTFQHGIQQRNAVRRRAPARPGGGRAAVQPIRKYIDNKDSTLSIIAERESVYVENYCVDRIINARRLIVHFRRLACNPSPLTAR